MIKKVSSINVIRLIFSGLFCAMCSLSTLANPVKKVEIINLEWQLPGTSKPFLHFRAKALQQPESVENRLFTGDITVTGKAGQPFMVCAQQVITDDFVQISGVAGSERLHVLLLAKTTGELGILNGKACPPELNLQYPYDRQLIRSTEPFLVVRRDKPRNSGRPLSALPPDPFVPEKTSLASLAGSGSGFDHHNHFKRPPFMPLPDKIMANLILLPTLNLPDIWRDYLPFAGLYHWLTNEGHEGVTIIVRFDHQSPIRLRISQSESRELAGHLLSVRQLLHWLAPRLSGREQLVQQLLELTADSTTLPNLLSEETLESIQEQLAVVLEQPDTEFSLEFELQDLGRRVFSTLPPGSIQLGNSPSRASDNSQSAGKTSEASQSEQKGIHNQGRKDDQKKSGNNDDREGSRPPPEKHPQGATSPYPRCRQCNKSLITVDAALPVDAINKADSAAFVVLSGQEVSKIEGTLCDRCHNDQILNALPDLILDIIFKKLSLEHQQGLSAVCSRLRDYYRNHQAGLVLKPLVCLYFKGRTEAFLQTAEQWLTQQRASIYERFRILQVPEYIIEASKKNVLYPLALLRYLSHRGKVAPSRFLDLYRDFSVNNSPIWAVPALSPGADKIYEVDGTRSIDMVTSRFHNLQKRQHGVQRSQLNHISLSVLANNQLVVLHSDGALHLWNPGVAGTAVDSNKPLELRGTDYFSKPYYSAGLSRSQLAVARVDHIMEIWDIKTATLITSLTGHLDKITAMAGLPDDRLASGSSDKTVKIWDIRKSVCIVTLEGHWNIVTSLAALQDERLASGSFDTTVKIWETGRGTCLFTLRDNCGAISALAVLADGRLASGSYDGVIRLWNTLSGTCETRFKAHMPGYTCLSVLPDARLVSGSSIGNHLKVWNVRTGTCEIRLYFRSKWYFLEENLISIAVMTDGRLVLSKTNDPVEIWDMYHPLRWH